MAPMSEPASGSDIEIDIRTSPASSFGIQWRFCSSVPLRRMFSRRTSSPPNAMKKSKLLHDSSSAMIARSITLPPSPPYSSGNGRRNRPASIQAS